MFSFHDNSHDTSVFYDEHVDNTTIDGTASDADHDKTENADDTVTDTVHVEADTDQTPHATACMEHDNIHTHRRAHTTLDQTHKDRDRPGHDPHGVLPSGYARTDQLRPH